jgi:hypothetical protein
MNRSRFKQATSLQERLDESRKAREQVGSLHPGMERLREQLLENARNADTAAHIDDWLTSPGLQRPR